MATYTDVLVSNSWTNVFDLAVFTAGTETVVFQNKGNSTLVLSFDSVAPDDEDEQGMIIFVGEKIIIPISCSYLWAKTKEDGITNLVILESASNYNSGNVIPDDIYTSTIANVRRLSVDSQPTSFEENTQFRFIDTFVNIDDAEDILYLFEQTAPIVVFDRIISLFTGGREYYVYPYDSSDTYTGTQDTLERVPLPMNNLLRNGLTSHPDTNVTITRYTVTDFTPVNYWVEMSQILAPTSGLTKVAGDYSAESVRYGTATASVSNPIRFWLYFPNLESTDATNGYWKIIWEERVN